MTDALVIPATAAGVRLCEAIIAAVASIPQNSATDGGASPPAADAALEAAPHARV